MVTRFLVKVMQKSVILSPVTLAISPPTNLLNVDLKHICSMSRHTAGLLSNPFFEFLSVLTSPFCLTYPHNSYTLWFVPQLLILSFLFVLYYFPASC